MSRLPPRRSRVGGFKLSEVGVHQAGVQSACHLGAGLRRRPTPPVRCPSPPVHHRAEYDAYALRRLRAAIAAADPGWTAGISGWGSPPADTTDPCAWRGVGCDEARRVTTMCAGQGPGDGAIACCLTAGGQAGRQADTHPPCPSRAPMPASSSLLFAPPRCSQLRNVGSASASSSAGGASGLPLAVDLPPELASLPRLQSLELRRHAGPPWSAIPPAWLARGAFARLET